MSIYSIATVTCPCGHRFTATVATSINVARTPAAGDALRAGSFHAFACPRCAHACRADTPFVYLDPGRQVLLCVGRAVGDDVDETVRRALDALDPGVDAAAPWTIVRAASLTEAPAVLREVERRLAGDRLAEDQGARRDPDVEGGLAGRAPDVAAEPGRADGARRSPQPTRVAVERFTDELVALAASIEAEPGRAPAKALIDRLHEHLGDAQWIPRQAFRAIERAIESLGSRGFGDLQGELSDVLLGVEFGKGFSEPARHALRALLRELPWRDARGNSALRRIHPLDAAGEGRTAAYDWDEGILSIGLDAASDPQSLRRKIVHEIGHGVHDNNRQRVDDWLRSRFGWQMYRADEAGVEKWVTRHLGGWPASWGSSERSTWTRRIIDAVIDPAQRDTLPRSLIPPPSAAGVVEAVANESKTRSKAAQDEVAAFIPYQLMTREMFCWYDEIASWPARNGERFSFNYFYGGLMVVRDTILPYLRVDGPTVATNILGTYAAMSPMECFAEFYVWLHSLIVGSVALPDSATRRDVSRLPGGWRTARQLNSGEVTQPAAAPPSWNWATDLTKAARAR